MSYIPADLSEISQGDLFKMTKGAYADMPLVMVLAVEESDEDGEWVKIYFRLFDGEEGATRTVFTDDDMVFRKFVI